MDFYVIHPYAYWVLPANTAAGWAQALDQPRQYYGTTIAALRAAFSQLTVCADFALRLLPILLAGDRTGGEGCQILSWLHKICGTFWVELDTEKMHFFFTGACAGTKYPNLLHGMEPRVLSRPGHQ